MTGEAVTQRSIVFVALGGAALLGLHGVHLWTGYGPGRGPSIIPDRVLLDTVAYSWLNRAHHLVESGSWWDHR